MRGWPGLSGLHGGGSAKLQPEGSEPPGSRKGGLFQAGPTPGAKGMGRNARGGPENILEWLPPTAGKKYREKKAGIQLWQPRAQ